MGQLLKFETQRSADVGVARSGPAGTPHFRSDDEPIVALIHQYHGSLLKLAAATQVLQRGLKNQPSVELFDQQVTCLISIKQFFEQLRNALDDALRKINADTNANRSSRTAVEHAGSTANQEHV